uniref:Reverse transcriptase zinc-binding domain-containing protein n=1 Tax=Brassica oleracea TaxID=3712 RepID=A0A3P6EZX6_BRAOL|nr:unnamed protein product [Brassica oleracea]
MKRACVAKINSMCRVFLWKGDPEAHNTARVAWSTVVKTKEEGGLGVKDLLLWNKACCLRLIWLIFFMPESVWAAWFKEVILKGSVLLDYQALAEFLLANKQTIEAKRCSLPLNSPSYT